VALIAEFETVSLRNDCERRFGSRFFTTTFFNAVLKSIQGCTMAGKCPQCQNMIGSVRAEPIGVTNVGGGSFSGASYTCPHCQTILGVTVDPFAFKNEIAIEVVKRMRGGR
jgi:hypothetical protein